MTFPTHFFYISALVWLEVSSRNKNHHCGYSGMCSLRAVEGGGFFVLKSGSPSARPIRGSGQKTLRGSGRGSGRCSFSTFCKKPKRPTQEKYVLKVGGPICITDEIKNCVRKHTLFRVLMQNSLPFVTVYVCVMFNDPGVGKLWTRERVRLDSLI